MCQSRSRFVILKRAGDIENEEVRKTWFRDVPHARLITIDIGAIYATMFRAI